MALLGRWDCPWHSLLGSHFNYDLIDRRPSVESVEFNFDNQAGLQAKGMGCLAQSSSSEQPAHNVFLRDGDEVFRTYVMHGRGAESLGGSNDFVDLTRSRI